MGTKDITITRGKTFRKVFQWEQASPVVSKAITAISFASGFPRLTVTSHGVPDGWRCTVNRVVGPKQINAKNNPPRDSDYYEVTVIDSNTIELNGVVPVDENGREWAEYVSGGFINYNTPRDLTGYTADVVMRDKVGGTVLLSSRLGDSPLNLITTDVDDPTKTITVVIDATDTAAITWNKAVYEIEMHGPSSVEALIEYEDEKGNKSEVKVLGELVT